MTHKVDGECGTYRARNMGFCYLSWTKRRLQSYGYCSVLLRTQLVVPDMAVTKTGATPLLPRVLRSGRLSWGISGAVRRRQRCGSCTYDKRFLHLLQR